MDPPIGARRPSDPVPSTVELDPILKGAVPQEAKVLEFACALGRTARTLREWGYKVSAFDMDPMLIEEAKGRSPSDIEFDVANALDLPYQDASYDACIMNGFMTVLPKPSERRKALSEAARVLRPSGVIYIGDFLQNWDSPLYKERYETHRPKTGEMGTFMATSDGSLDGIPLYLAHHYTLPEVRELVGPLFTVKLLKLRSFRSFHGNLLNGFVLIGEKR